MEENKAFMSLYEYRGHKDTDGVGSQLYRFARIIGAPKAHKIVPHSKYNDGKIEIYPKETIDTFFKVKKIFDKLELCFPFEKKIDTKKNISDKPRNELPKINKTKENMRVVQKKIELEKPSEVTNPNSIKLQEVEKELSFKKEIAPNTEISELQRAIEDFRNTPHPLLDTKEKEKMINNLDIFKLPRNKIIYDK
jgi:hypothetical protein